MIRETIFMLTPNRNHKFEILKHMEKYYLNKGYLPVNKNFINKKFNFKLLRKLKILIKMFAYSDFIFDDPKKRDFVIYDCETTKEIKKILPNNNYKVVSTRIGKIKKIYISKKIFFYIAFNFFKRSLKQNYLAALIKAISPKVVVTHIDNSSDFSITAKIFNNEIKFIAVQNANRGDVVYLPTAETKKIFIPEFLCFSNYDEELYKKKECNIGKFEIVGSLRSSLSNEYVKSKNISFNEEKYDICLISEPYPIVNGDWSHVKNWEDGVGKIAEYTYRLCEKKKLNLIFSGQGEPNDDTAEMEICFYKKYFKNYNYKIFQAPRNEYPTYQNIMQSKLIIGNVSTVLREAFSFEKKVLSCNFIKHPDIKFPSDGLCLLKNANYESFEKRVLDILSMSKEKYFKGLTKDKNIVMKSTVDTASIIRNKFKKYAKI